MGEDVALRAVARRITQEHFGNDLRVGGCFLHRPDGKGDGYPIMITGGCFLDSVYGRLSNHWSWKRILPSGKLSAKEESGYGGRSPHFEKIDKDEALRLAKAKR